MVAAYSAEPLTSKRWPSNMAISFLKRMIIAMAAIATGMSMQ
jgi:hypothetical protein